MFIIYSFHLRLRSRRFGRPSSIIQWNISSQHHKITQKIGIGLIAFHLLRGHLFLDGKCRKCEDLKLESGSPAMFETVWNDSLVHPRRFPWLWSYSAGELVPDGFCRILVFVWIRRTFLLHLHVYCQKLLFICISRYFKAQSVFVLKHCDATSSWNCFEWSTDLRGFGGFNCCWPYQLRSPAFEFGPTVLTEHPNSHEPRWICWIP